MRAALALLVAVGLPFLDGALVGNSRRASGRLSAFARSPLLALKGSTRLVSTPPQHHAAEMQHARPQQQRCSVASLSCTATGAEGDAGAVTLLEGTYNIDGFRSNYIVAKPPGYAAETSSPPLVLIHGFGSNKAHFSKNMQVMAASTGTAVYALDLLGHGQSAKPLGVSYDCSLWDWQVETLVKEVIGSKVFLVGHSLGGYIAMRLAARSPRDVAGLCLIAPAGRYGVLHPLSFNVPFIELGPVASVLGAQTFSKISTTQGMRTTLEYLYKDPSSISQEMVDALSSPWLDMKSRAAGEAICKAIYQSALDAPWDKLISTDEVRTTVMTRKRSGNAEETFVTMTYCGPVLTLWGQDDAFLPPQTNIEAIQELRADALSEVKMIDAGHCPHDERPEQVNALITEWVSKVLAQDAEFPIPRKPRYRNAPIADATVLKF